MNEVITMDIVDIFERYPTMLEATNSMIDKLIVNLESEGTITGYTFSSMVSEMATLSDPVRKACAELYAKIQGIYFKKLMEDGYSKELASNIALMMTASIEGAMMLCLAEKSAKPLKVILQLLPNILKEF
ncbi:hypothetical protein QFZ73_003288 [Peribacillus sp. V2I11]|nr:hypothetical protein [Peribacillus sp. V2I11]